MGLEPLRAEAKRTIGRGPQRAIGAPSVGVAIPCELAVVRPAGACPGVNPRTKIGGEALAAVVDELQVLVVEYVQRIHSCDSTLDNCDVSGHASGS